MVTLRQLDKDQKLYDLGVHTTNLVAQNAI